MRFRVLGPLEVIGTADALRFAPRQRAVLSMLLLEANRIVSVERLVDAVWDSNPPSTAKEQIQICVSAIRRSLREACLPSTVVRRAPGYSIECTDEQLDLLAFERFASEGRQAMAQRLPADAVDRFGQALELWRGEPLGGVNSRLVDSSRIVLTERRLAVIGEYVDAQLQLGRQHELIGELVELVASNPFRERLRIQLMLALHRTGRRADALEVYRTGRRLLADELGLDPGEGLLRAERAVLAGDAEAEIRDGVPRRNRLVAPHLLPPTIRDFTGRVEPVARIRELLCSNADSPGVRIVALSGRAWTGKTTLAVHAAHDLHDDFPDGQLFVQLGGSTSRPADAAEVLERFLRALGFDNGAIPAGVDERAETYRNSIAGHRMLVVLDDAADERQVLPLLPGSPSCTVIVTSRRRLTALAGAWHLKVGSLSTQHALELLSKIAGTERLAAQPRDSLRLVDVCGGEPLALRLAAALLAARPQWSVGTLVERLASEDRRLDEFSHGGVDITGAITQVYERLTPSARRLVRRLGLLGARGFASWVCVPLLGVTPEEADDVLAELVDAGVLDVESAGERRATFHLRGLFEAFARRRSASDETPSERLAALRRLLGTWSFVTEQVLRRAPESRRTWSSYPGGYLRKVPGQEVPDSVVIVAARRTLDFGVMP